LELSSKKLLNLVIFLTIFSQNKTIFLTIRGFKEILEGKHDDLPESAFLFAGAIEDVREKAKGRA